MKMIKVIDSFGNLLQETYEKRARGLVKKGRAYFIDVHTICLIRQMKEKTMDTLTIQDIMDRLDTITKDKEHIKEAMLLMERIPNDIDAEAVKARSEAISKIVEEREETNRKIVAFLETMYQKF